MLYCDAPNNQASGCVVRNKFKNPNKDIDETKHESTLTEW